MAQTEAQIRAKRKYREKQVYLQARVTPEEKENIIAHVAVTEESLNDFMRRAFVETIERDNAKSKDNSK